MNFSEGWYPDPWSQYEYRWWSGTAWTEHVGQGGTRLTAPLPPNQVIHGEATASLAHDNTAREYPQGDEHRAPDPWSMKGQSRLFGMQLSPVPVLVILAIFVAFAVAVWTGINDGANQRSELQELYGEHYGN